MHLSLACAEFWSGNFFPGFPGGTLRARLCQLCKSKRKSINFTALRAGRNRSLKNKALYKHSPHIQQWASWMTTCCICESGLLDYSVTCAEWDGHLRCVPERDDSNSHISRTEKLIGGLSWRAKAHHGKSTWKENLKVGWQKKKIDSHWMRVVWLIFFPSIPLNQCESW